ncbi:hypothetical protein [Limoniibacter endophyticus]|uniref:Uncharacterized protein n=1 Tax=Limoniibacter endophyticus TaxID=1565040 RepID=A0A8J3GFM0_9HYPH|nr:hypothetical protein [Limoniibacter endophyticus]GHC67723.1 hypothetical protein GCM10010136_12030 [Limoniibacter endophyticus]
MKHYVFKNNYKKLQIKIRLQGEEDAHKTLNYGDSISFNIERAATGKHIVKYGRAVVQQLDLNNGYSSDDINMPNTSLNRHDAITYKPNRAAGEMVLTDFGTASAAIIDRDGVAKNEPAVLFQTLAGETLTSVLSPFAIALDSLTPFYSTSTFLCGKTGL